MSRVLVHVEGRQLALSNLDKVLYPATGFTKGQVLDYYSRIAPTVLPHLQGRVLTLKRWPDGVEGPSFFEKNAPSHRPDWLRVHRVASPGSATHRDTIDYAVVENLAGLMWVANLATLELHTPLWRIGCGPDLVVFDLDPGPPADIVACCRVALLLHACLRADGLEPIAKTSGSKGLQVYAPARGLSGADETLAYAKGLAQHLESTEPDLVVSRMPKALRTGKVLIDWSQNHAAKTTVSVYSLRALRTPTVSTPVSWQEVASCAVAGDLVFDPDLVLERVARDGDLFAPLLGG